MLLSGCAVCASYIVLPLIDHVLRPMCYLQRLKEHVLKLIDFVLPHLDHVILLIRYVLRFIGHVPSPPRPLYVNIQRWPNVQEETATKDLASNC